MIDCLIIWLILIDYQLIDSLRVDLQRNLQALSPQHALHMLRPQQRSAIFATEVGRMTARYLRQTEANVRTWLYNSSRKARILRWDSGKAWIKLWRACLPLSASICGHTIEHNDTTYKNWCPIHRSCSEGAAAISCPKIRQIPNLFSNSVYTLLKSVFPLINFF